MIYTITQLQNILSGTFLNFAGEASVKNVNIDTRILSNGNEMLFFAIVTKNNDGHFYLQDAFNKGIRNFIVEKAGIQDVLTQEAFHASNILMVKNSVGALQQLAIHYRNEFSIPVIGITGSNGKTIIKEWLFHLLSEDVRICRSPKSFNSQLGVPISVLGLEHDQQLAIFEAGISTTGEMELLYPIIKPDVGIFTNIGQAHHEGFNSQSQKIDEKLKLFRNCKSLIYCADHTEIAERVLWHTNNTEGYKNIELFSWSMISDAPIKVRIISNESNSTRLEAHFRNSFSEIIIPFSDKASVENVIHCWVYMLLTDYPPEKIQQRMNNLAPIEMRLELKEGMNNCTIINDSYNSDINSLGIALDFLNQQSNQKKKTLILSDIFETGKNQSEFYNEVYRIILEKGVDRFIGIGESLYWYSNVFAEIPSEFYKKTADFIARIEKASFVDEVILIKGSRVFGFEKITNVLQKKAHTTILELNLQSIIHNLNVYKSLLKPGTRIMAMVKAASYGSGTFEIANVLQYHHVDYLAVAYADEGVELRKEGILAPVMVMNPEADAFPVMFEHQLEPEIYSLRLLNALVKYSLSDVDQQQFPVHIKLDTGMHRLGFDQESLDEMLEILKHNQHIKVKSVFSHLAASDNSNEDEFTLKQINTFREFSDYISDRLGYRPMMHISNSVGIIRFPDACFDMVRLGLGLYGIDASSEVQDKLENVSTFKTTISQIRHLPKGDMVGYSRRGLLKRDSVVATIGVGYADGFPRALGNGKGTVLVKDAEVPVIGDVCMDMTMIDVTGLDVHEGDEVIIFGKQFPVQLMAEKLGTIPYEVLTGISQRVKRVYFKD
jgi:alanine racemase